MVKVPNPFRSKAYAAKSLALRKELWPSVTNDQLWIRTERDGFTTIPRAMPYIQIIMDDLNKGKPLSTTYFALWCRSKDEGFVVINSEKELAFESGFFSSRAQHTWAERMRLLRDLGFIDAKPGSKGEWSHVLLFNPYMVVRALRKTHKIQDQTWSALFGRAQEIGAIEFTQTEVKAAT